MKEEKVMSVEKKVLQSTRCHSSRSLCSGSMILSLFGAQIIDNVGGFSPVDELWHAEKRQKRRVLAAVDPRLLVLQMD